jgi:hypothetical protein
MDKITGAGELNAGHASAIIRRAVFIAGYAA